MLLEYKCITTHSRKTYSLCQYWKHSFPLIIFISEHQNDRYLVVLTTGPTFFTPSIQFCLSHTIAVFGEDLASFKPRPYIISFIISDIISLILQATGGSKASGALTYDIKQSGIHIMVAGLAFQVVSLVVFLILFADFIYKRPQIVRIERSPTPKHQIVS